MPRGQRTKTYSAAEKLAILQEVKTSSKTVAVLAEEYGVNPNTITQWKKQVDKFEEEVARVQRKKREVEEDGGLFLSDDHERNKLVIQKLLSDCPIHDDIAEDSCKSGVSKHRCRYRARIQFDDNEYSLGSYDTWNDAAKAYLTAQKFFVYNPKIQKVLDEIKRLDAIDAEVKEAIANGEDLPHVKPKFQYKLTNRHFFEDGRGHHEDNRNALPPNDDHYTNEECQLVLSQIDEKIEESKELALRLRRETYMGRLDSIPIRRIIAIPNHPIHEYFLAGPPKNLDELAAMVKKVVPDKDLSFFLNRDSLRQPEDYPLEVDYHDYLRDSVYGMVGQRMILWLANSCIYCGKKPDFDDGDKWWAVTTEHLEYLGEKIAQTSHLVTQGYEKAMMEMIKTVSACRACNPIGDHNRRFPIDRFYWLRIPVLDNELPPYQSINEILDSTKFETFIRRAIDDMNLEYSMKVDDEGYPLHENARTGRCATFLELKLLIWETFELLLEDLVMWRKISDYGSPRHAFRTTVMALLKVLTNQCPGSNGKCTGWKNLRNVCPWQLSGIHFDHNSGDGTWWKDDAVSQFIDRNWKTFIGEIRKCNILCCDCHKGD